MLTKGDKASNYREVTAEERTIIEAADARWQRPPQSFIDEWNTLCGQYGKYNEQTGFFELNGITNFTFDDAVLIRSFHNPESRDLTGAAMDMTTLRTVIPRRYRIDSNFVRAFQSAINLESFVTVWDSCYPTDMSMAFWNCKKLKRVYGHIEVHNCKSFSNAFTGCSALEEADLRGLKCNISFADSPLLRITSLNTILTSAANTSPITITLHPDTYASLTDDVITKAADKQIILARA